jgi:hypothetical protein
MATEWSEMKAHFSDETIGRAFEPCAHYDADSDAVTFYFSNEPDYGKRLNSRVTIYLSDETDELVGCRVKGVRTVLEDIGSFDVSISHGKVKLTMLFAAFHGVFGSDADSRTAYRRIGQAATESDLELELPEYA